MPEINRQFNPLEYIEIGMKLGTLSVPLIGRHKHTPVKAALSVLVNNVLIATAADGPHPPLRRISKKEVDDEKLYLDLGPSAVGLTVDMGNGDRAAYAQELVGELKKLGFKYCQFAEGKFQIGTNDSVRAGDQTRDAATAAEELANDVHREIGIFLIYILKLWLVDKHNYFRDIYCDKSGRETGQYGLSDETERALQARFDKVHWKHGASDSKEMFKRKVTSFVSAREAYEHTDLHAMMNLLIHTFSLKKSPQTPAIAPSAPAVDGPKKTLTLMERGDLFLEIDRLVDGDNAVVFSADNPFRPGGGLLLGGRGSMEEYLMRSGDYLKKLSALLDIKDPIGELIRWIYDYLQPLPGRSIRLTSTKGNGIPASCNNLDIPEYITKEQTPLFISFSRKMAERSKGLEYTSSYRYQKVDVQGNATVTRDVLQRQTGGNIVTINMLGMVGIDGRENSFLKDSLGFADEYQESSNYYDEKTGCFMNDYAVSVYTQRWTTALAKSIEVSPKKIILNAVGCGAFDPTKQRHFSQASAQGFANALSNRITHSGTIASIIDHLIGKKIEVIFPLYDPNVYRLFKLALIERYNGRLPGLLENYVTFVDSKPAAA